MSKSMKPALPADVAIAFGDFRVVPLGCTTGASLGGDRHLGIANDATVA